MVLNFREAGMCWFSFDLFILFNVFFFNAGLIV